MRKRKGGRNDGKKIGDLRRREVQVWEKRKRVQGNIQRIKGRRKEKIPQERKIKEGAGEEQKKGGREKEENKRKRGEKKKRGEKRK